MELNWTVSCITGLLGRNTNFFDLGLVLQMAMPGLSAGRQGIVGAASQPAPLPASLASRLGNTNGPVQTSLRRTNRMDNVVVTKTVLPPASFKVILH